MDSIWHKEPIYPALSQCWNQVVMWELGLYTQCSWPHSAHEKWSTYGERLTARSTTTPRQVDLTIYGRTHLWLPLGVKESMLGSLTQIPHCDTWGFSFLHIATRRDLWTVTTSGVNARLTSCLPHLCGPLVYLYKVKRETQGMDKYTWGIWVDCVGEGVWL